MNSLPHSSGIYRITCLENGKIYIGSAVNLNKRWRMHQWGLNNSKHANPHLQSAWDKYGSTSFEFEIIEMCDVSELPMREQYWINELQPFDRTIGFNIALDTQAPMRGRKASTETKEKLSALRKGTNHLKGYRQTEEHKAKRGIAQRGKKMSPEAIAKTVAGKEKLFIVTTPNGEEILIKGLAKFCRENGLNRGNMMSVISGKRTHNHGWKCRYA